MTHILLRKKNTHITCPKDDFLVITVNAFVFKHNTIYTLTKKNSQQILYRENNQQPSNILFIKPYDMLQFSSKEFLYIMAFYRKGCK